MNLKYLHFVNYHNIGSPTFTFRLKIFYFWWTSIFRFTLFYIEIFLHENRGEKIGPISWACLFCPHFNAGQIKNLDSHLLMCVFHMFRFFAGFCRHGHLHKFLCFLGLKGADRLFPLHPHFLQDWLRFYARNLKYVRSTSFFACFCMTDLNGTNMPVCHPYKKISIPT